MELIDAQMHLWPRATEDRPWGGAAASKPHGPPEMTAETMVAEMEVAGVDGALLVPPSFQGDRNDTVLAAAQRHPNRFRVQARMPMAAPAPDRFEQLRCTQYVVGVRITSNAASRSWLTDGTLDWYWPLANDVRFPTAIYPWAQDATGDSGQLDALAEIAARYPDAPIVIDHAGLGQWVEPDSAAAEAQALRPLSKYPNVAVKLMGFSSVLRDRFEATNVARIVLPLIEWFGPSRCFWGENTTYTPMPYRQAVEVFLDALASLTTAEQEDVMGQSLRRWYRWDAATQGARATEEDPS